MVNVNVNLNVQTHYQHILNIMVKNTSIKAWTFADVCGKMSDLIIDTNCWISCSLPGRNLSLSDVYLYNVL